MLVEISQEALVIYIILYIILSNISIDNYHATTYIFPTDKNILLHLDLYSSANSSRGVPPTPAEGGALLYIPHHILLYTMSPQSLVYYILNNPSHSN